MTSDKKIRLRENILSDFKNSMNKSRIGFEKESIRIENETISQRNHPIGLGSSLCNEFITTDFSEAQLELVTPPYEDKLKTIDFLDDIHHFVMNHLDNEHLWPFSFPTDIKEESIRIASYGISNKGKFKRLYRKGLSSRYGKLMQSISGVHFNYSAPSDLWKNQSFQELKLEQKKSMRSELYLNMVRNIYRNNWLILYLFGASPLLGMNFAAKDSKLFKKLDEKTLFMPYATSLRMSEYGYQNSDRAQANVSLDTIECYINDIRSATSEPNDKFKEIDLAANDGFFQISENTLQIDDEHYAVARAKSSINILERTTSKLSYGGVDFIELRSLDLDPFSTLGISQETVYFLDLFMAHCFLKQEPPLSKDEKMNISNNDSLVSKQGRMPNLKLIKNKEKISLNRWANDLLDDLFSIKEFIDDTSHNYSKSLDSMRERINNSELTPSSMILEQIHSRNISYSDLGMEIAANNKNYFLERDISGNSNWNTLDSEAKKSILRQMEMENNDSQTFQEYIHSYFSE